MLTFERTLKMVGGEVDNGDSHEARHFFQEWGTDPQQHLVDSHVHYLNLLPLFPALRQHYLSL